MTDLIDRADSGDIHRLDDLGEDQTEDLRHRMNRRDTTGEHTRNLAPEIAGLPPRRRPDATGEIPRLIDAPLGLAGNNFDGPQKPPPPLPKPKDPAETGVNIFGGLGADLPEAAFPGYVGRHRHPEGQDVVVGRYWEMQRPAYERRLSPWWAVVAVAVVGLAIWVGLTLAAAAVIW